MSWLETIPPLAIIGTMLVIAGSSQSLFNKLLDGKPKHLGTDLWDKAMAERDAHLLKEAAEQQKQ